MPPLPPCTLSPASRHAPRRYYTPPFRLPQYAHAFNQPLSLDTSKVTDMYGMFQVRPARALTLKP
jgi:hypothetical protein